MQLHNETDFSFLFFSFFLMISSFCAARPPKKIIINGYSSSVPCQVLTGSGKNGGGVVIAPRWVLTAGHLSASTTWLKAGVTNRSQAGQQPGILTKIKHPTDDQGNNPSNDLALYYLSEDLQYSPGLESIQLASSANSSLWQPGQSADVSGFGNTASGQLSQTLQRVTVNINSIDETNNKILTVGPGTNDACNGDSGGPLISQNKLIGTVSSTYDANNSGDLCGNGGKYMRVASYIPWIVKTIHENGTPNLVCGNTTFTNIDEMPDGCSMAWSASPSNLFTETSGSDLTFTTAAASQASGAGVITLTIHTPEGSFPHTKSVWVGKPGSINLTTDGTFWINGGMATICAGSGYCMTSAPNGIYNAGVTHFSYSGWPTYNAFSSTSTQSIQSDRFCFGSNNTGQFYLTVYANNACGTSSRGIAFNVTNCGYRVAPNPATTTINVEFEEPTKSESLPDLVELFSEKTSKSVKAIKKAEGKEIIDLTTGNKLGIDVAKLPRGVYYLHLTFPKRKENQTDKVRILLD